tara:strand:+ start:104 stop:490 length:387 start_codon:yes stop_codon:yes gene_type:complete
MTIDKFIKIAIFLAATAIALGALGAHALKEILISEKLASFQTGIRYQMYHAISILVLALNTKTFNHKLNRSLNLMTIGVFLFSFSIYFLSLEEILDINFKFLGPITPLGGILMIAGWLNLFFAIKKNN